MLNCTSILDQIELAINTTIEMVNTLDEADLLKRPTPGKHSLGELLEHIAIICEADWLISMGASEQEMTIFYEETSYNTLDKIKEGLTANFNSLKNNYTQLSNDELNKKTISHWGATYTRYEWLIEILAHVYHHRGQLHAILVHCYKEDPKILLFN